MQRVASFLAIITLLALTTLVPTTASQEPQSPQTVQAGSGLAAPAISKGAESPGHDPSHWYASPEWWLVGVGVLTFWAIRYQARETALAAKATQKATEGIGKQVEIMERQTRATEIAASAAHDSADALINSERAWIDGELIRETFPTVRYRLKIVNHGKTPARMLSFEINCGCLSEGTEFSPQRLSIHNTGKLHFLLGTDKSRLLEEVEPLNMHVVFGGCSEAGAYCVTVRYADVVAKYQKAQDRETSFVYYCRFLLDSLERLSEYDKYT
jgi:hypothetical protein